DLSNWYIRRNRDRFWASELNDSKKSVYITTYEVLTGLCKLCAPIIPFVTEEMYQKLTGEDSVHLANYPTYESKYIHDDLEEKMDLVRTFITLGRNAREEVKIKVREPLRTLYLDGKVKSTIDNLVSLIQEELNVKNVEFIANLSEYMNFTVKPNFKVVGKMFGAKMRQYQTLLESLSVEQIEALEKGDSIIVSFDGEDLEITPEMVDIRVESREGFNVTMEGRNFVILDTNRDEELILEGLARELVSKVQNLRKSMDFNVVDRIALFYSGTEKFKKALELFKDYIMEETLATEMTLKDNLENKYDLNGEEVFLDIQKN
ncbi:MAG: class I tRNA ligase family protein, partial [Bacilli bacterium]|nr:class I tRNA ligase family protein [Bacilli bacterium]